MLNNPPDSDFVTNILETKSDRLKYKRKVHFSKMLYAKFILQELKVDVFCDIFKIWEFLS